MPIGGQNWTPIDKKRRRANIEMKPQPRGARLFLNRREGAPHRVLADDFLHAQELRHNAVAA